MNTSALALTLDVDWASDEAIDAAAAILQAHDVRSTWFVTHASPAIDRLRERPDLFELGVHPNFLPGSSHGGSVEEVWRTVMDIVPEARASRSHALYQSTPMFWAMLQYTPIRIDSSLQFPPGLWVSPFPERWGTKTILRVPFVWSDDSELLEPEPLFETDRFDDWQEDPLVLLFHPRLLAQRGDVAVLFDSLCAELVDDVWISEIKGRATWAS